MNIANPKILSVAVSLNASSIPLLKEPLDILQADGFLEHRFRLSGRVGWADLVWADILVFQNSQENIDLRSLITAKRLNRRVIFHTDDHYLAIPREMMKTKHFHYPHRLRNYQTFLKTADRVLVTTGALAEALGAYTDRPIAVSENLPAYERLLAAPPRPSDDGCRRFYYAASDVNFRYFEEIAGQAVRRIMAEYGDKVHFTFIGGGLKGAEPSLTSILPRQPLESYLNTLAGLTLDVGLAPVPDSDYSRYKTNLKFREYGARGLGGLYSRVPIYEETVRDKITGLLVNNGEESWYRAIKWAVEHPDEIRAMGREARAEIEANNTARSYADFWRDRVIEPLLSENIPGWGASATGRLDRMIYSGHSALDRRWRRLRTAWYDAFYLDRNPHIKRLKKLLNR